MKPVWIRYYGLIPMTRRGYLIAVAVMAFLALGFVGYLAVAGHLPPVRTLWQRDPNIDKLGPGAWLTNRLWLFLVVLLLAAVLETYFVLRRFDEKEAALRAQEEAAGKAAAQTPSESPPVGGSAVPAQPTMLAPGAVAPPAENSQQPNS
jgi:hypothetical protein